MEDIEMRKYAVVLVVVLVSMLLAVSGGVQAAAFSQTDAALAWMRDAQEPDGGFSSGFAEGSDFGTTAEVILAVAATGQDISTWLSSDGLSPLDYVASQVSSGPVTDVGNVSKAVFVAVAAGLDPRDFGGRDLVAQVMAAQDSATGMFGDTLFKHAYAVLALHNAGEPLPSSAAAVLTSQFTDDGGWALFGGTTPGMADTNTTAFAMQALIGAGEPGAAGGALSYLRRMQNEDGGFPYQKPSAWGTETDANSTAVVIMALNALDEPMGNWVVNGTDPLGALLALWDGSSGAYFWQASVPFANMLATAQAVQAAEGMTFVAVPRVGASRPPSAAVGGAVQVPLMPESGSIYGPGVGLALLGALVLVGAAAALRRSQIPCAVVSGRLR